VIDAAGVIWDLYALIDVPNQTVTLGSDFGEFTQHCESGRRKWTWVFVPSLLDKIWNPPEVFAGAVQRAIHTAQPAITNELGSLIEERGKEAFHLILAPSLIRGKQSQP